MAEELKTLAAAAVEQAEQFQRDARRIENAHRAGTLAEIVKELTERAIADGERIDERIDDADAGGD